MAKSAARQVTNQIVRGMWGVCWGEKKVSQVRLPLPDATLRAASGLHYCNILNFHDLSGMNETHFANNKKGAFAPFIRSFGYDLLINSHRLIKKKLALGNSAPMIGGMP
ncbi:hypothetical protein ACLK2D_22685 [Escherichia coli]